MDISRTIEEVLTAAPLDFVHVHEPFAPSASSVALRHSRALNVGTFHAPAERVLSTQVARRFVELFFGRLDARTASFEATRELMQRVFPADYARAAARRDRRVARPRARRARSGSRSATRRSAPRCGSSCARCGGCRPSSTGRRPCSSPTGAAPTLRSRLRDRVHVLVRQDTSEDAVLAAADVVVAASHGIAPLAGPARARARRRRGAGRVAPAGSYEEVLAATASSACCSSPATSTCSPPSSSG